ncbi:ARM repeat-containing protein [Basidiobolus meristosporus CBS 931.73]|uniref:ARM repeat-containing protein n=1 Tax=Basidiobolus meristosporus CBS 931.73 TaxID=1314790 RepID=A0A1Y1Y0B0_9FUNG|nr:ARM repeat-containing protein [Basidiobolus meristosporus CBS 931.73]|eukprot:ORX91441.1 ARM repeat-containing protein [Basidiobolus meristosporus CBS 931.73]
MTPLEINRDLSELSVQLNTVLNNDKPANGPHLKRCISRLLELATKGYNLSSLLKDIIMVAAKCEWIDRKLMYYILSLQATLNPEIFLMLVNSLRKDCASEIGTIRAQALKILCTFPNTLDSQEYKSYLIEALKPALSDTNAYVRKTAMALLPTIRRRYGILEEFNPILVKLVDDSNAEVSAGAVAQLYGVVGSDLSMSSRDFSKLLNKIDQVDSWSRCKYLPLMNNYAVSTENELQKILSRLKHNLQHSHQGVVFGTMEFIIKQASRFPTLLPDVLSSLKRPLLNAVALGDQELMYISLAHLHTILMANPNVAATLRYRDFYCRDQDISFLKQQKIRMLVDMVTQENGLEVLDELYLYAVSGSTAVAQSSILAISQITEKSPELSTPCLRKLHDICSRRDAIIPFVFTSISICLRNLPSQEGSSIFTRFFVFLNHIRDSNDAMIAFLRILGKYAAYAPETPYILEEFIRITQPASATDVYVELLHCTLAAFFQRPGECRDLLGFLMKRGTGVDVPTPVLERTRILYALLKSERSMAQQMLETYYNLHFDTSTSIDTSKPGLHDFNTLKIALPSWVDNEPYDIPAMNKGKGKAVLIDLTNDMTNNAPSPVTSVE